MTTKTKTKERSYGPYTPNLGFKVVNTEYGDLNISIYTYARYLNQFGAQLDLPGRFRQYQDRSGAPGFPVSEGAA